MELKQKLLSIQTELKAPKNQFNSFGNYNYRSCEDILEAVKPLCKKGNVLLTLSDTIKHVGERYYVEATATLYDVETDDCISVSAYAREEETKKGMDSSQITGAASSYARKYALNGLFNIDDTKDSDSTNEGDGKHKTSPKPKAEPKNDYQSQLKELMDNSKGKITGPMIAETIEKKFGKRKANELNETQFLALLEELTNEANS
jgi:hypothetical protein